jgi:alpha-L-rhamnosidase
MTNLSNASWIWAARSQNSPHQYVLFRKTFTTSGLPDGLLHISADSDFVAYLDGNEIGRGQYSDYPHEKTYSTFRTGPLLPGKQASATHTLAIHAYYRGADFSEHRAGNPGLICSLTSTLGKPILVSDASFKAILDPAFTHGPLPRVTNQMGFTTLYDARKALDFINPAFDDSAWAPASVEASSATGGFWKSLTPRPVPPLGIAPVTQSRIALQGDIIGPDAFKARDYSVAQKMANSALIARRFWDAGFYANPSLVPTGTYVSPPPGPSDLLFNSNPADQLQLLPPPADSGATGRFLIFDLGENETGLLTFSLTAPEGARLDIAHGEHIKDGRVRVHLGGRQFADAYTCKAGLNEFTLPFRRLGAQYIEVHFSNYRTPIHLHHVGLKPTHLNIGREADLYVTHSDMIVPMLELSVRTLRLCMHEHYEDCPWREQSLYAYDSRNQALYGYYAFPNYDFAKASFNLLGRGIRDDGLLELCAPAKIPITIPVFSMAWIVECQEHWLYSGDSTLFSTFETQMASMVDKWLSDKDIATGLYLFPEGKQIWNYYEWSSGLAGSAGEPGALTRLHAPYNLHLHEALGALAWMFEHAGNAEQAAKYAQVRAALGRSIAKTFYNPDTRLYSTFLTDGKLSQTHQLTNALMLHQGLVPWPFKERVIDALMPPVDQLEPYLPDIGRITLAATFYLFEAIRREAPDQIHRLDTLLNPYRHMIQNGATSLWETVYGASDFHDAGSLCHAWSSLPIYYVAAIVGGIVPLEPGYSKVLIAPALKEGQTIDGFVPTPHGPILVRLTRQDGKIHGDLNIPRGVDVQFKPLNAVPGVIEFTNHSHM